MDLLSEESLAYTSPSDAAQDGALTSAQCAELIVSSTHDAVSVNTKMRLVSTSSNVMATILSALTTTGGEESALLDLSMALPFGHALCAVYVDDVVTVSDDAICAGMVVLQQAKQLVLDLLQKNMI